MVSKSKSNLVFVSQLRNSDVDPMAIRLTLLRHHYRTDWEWTDDQLWESADMLDRWRRALAVGAGARSEDVVAAVLAALPSAPDAPTAGAGVDPWAEAGLGTNWVSDTSGPGPGSAVPALLDAELGRA